MFMNSYSDAGKGELKSVYKICFFLTSPLSDSTSISLMILYRTQCICEKMMHTNSSTFNMLEKKISF